AVRRREVRRHPRDPGPRRAPQPPSRDRRRTREVPPGSARSGRVAASSEPEVHDGPERNHEPGESVRGGRVMEEFSARTRTKNLAAMASGPVDVLVVGGGIVGAWVALTSALRGHRTALVEKRD